MNGLFGWLPIVMLTLSSLAWADRARAPLDYVMDVAKGQYVFVMLANRDNNLLDPGAPDDVGVIDSDKEIRKRYRQSGLYRTHPLTPLWSVSWYAFKVFPASDGEHLIRMGPWASSPDQLALAFYANGREIKQYLIRDLVKDPSRLRYTVSHFFWLAEASYDDKTQLFHVKTVDSQPYTFSILTGERVPE